MGRYRTAQTWKIIGMFYSDEPVEADPDDSVQEDMSEGDTSTENNTDLDDAIKTKQAFISKSKTKIRQTTTRKRKEIYRNHQMAI